MFFPDQLEPYAFSRRTHHGSKVAPSADRVEEAVIEGRGVKVGRGVGVVVGVGERYHRGVGEGVRVGGTIAVGVISTSGG